MLPKLKAFFIKHRQPLFFALLGIAAGILPSISNHMGEFWCWSFWAKTASYFGFWIIFVVLIIMRSSSRKLAALNVFLFCFIMCIVYGIVETIYKIPSWASGNLSTTNIFGNHPIGLFFDYQFGQIIWFVVIIALIPISKLIHDYLHQKVTTTIRKILVNLLVLAPLLAELIRLFGRISSPVIVCADIANHWTPGLCTFQPPDTWIIANLIIEATIYIAFIIFWIIHTKDSLCKKYITIKLDTKPNKPYYKDN